MGHPSWLLLVQKNSGLMYARLCRTQCVAQPLSSMYVFSMCIFLLCGRSLGDGLASDLADVSWQCSTLFAPFCVFLETWLFCVALPGPWDNSQGTSVSLMCAHVCVFACVPVCDSFSAHAIPQFGFWLKFEIGHKNISVFKVTSLIFTLQSADVCLFRDKAYRDG